MSVDPKKMKGVARRFIQQYYAQLFEKSTTHLSLYSEESHFFHGHNLENGESVTGVRNIGECLAKLSYHGGSVDLQHGSMDIQPSANGGYILMVTGLFKCRADSEPCQFTHTFFLAKNPKGAPNSLFVLNDCLRFIDKSNLNEEYQTKCPEFIAEETKQTTSAPKHEVPETIEVQPTQIQQQPAQTQPEVVIPEKESQFTEPQIESVVNKTSSTNIDQLDGGWGEPNLEEEDDENDSDYVDEEQDDVDEDDDEELFDDNGVENDTASADFIEHDEILPKRTEGKWVPKKKLEEGAQNKATTGATTTTQQTVNPSETKREEPIQHHHQHVHKQTPVVSQTEQMQPETQTPKVISYAHIARKNTSQPSNPAPTNVIKKKPFTNPSVTTQTQAPLTTNTKTFSSQTQQNLPNLYIRNLTEAVTEEELKTTFSSYGPIKKIFLKTGIAFIEFTDNSIVANIVNDGKQNPFSFHGQAVKVDFTLTNTQSKNQNGGTRGTGRGGGQFNNASFNNRQNKTRK